MTDTDSAQTTGAARPRVSRAAISRRVLLGSAVAGAAGVTAWSVLRARPGAHAAAATGPAGRVMPFGAGWLFGPAQPGADRPAFDDGAFAPVAIPHTVTPLSWRDWDPSTWEGTWCYRKHFDAPPGVADPGLTGPGRTGPADKSLGPLRVFLDFDGAMTRAVVTINGTQVADHRGGYLPFSVELTGALKPKDNVLAVTLDSAFNLDVPPDRPAPYTSDSVDFWQPGGIYRDVRLRLVPPVFLSGVFARPVNVLDDAARQVIVEVTVDAAALPPAALTLAVELRDAGGTAKSIREVTVPVPVTAPGETTVTATLSDIGPVALWDTEHPTLYPVIATLYADKVPLHDYQVRIGFREALFKTGGFYLNGVRTKLFGLNRHQLFPFAGGALPDRAQARDAAILRQELNCNVVRCSHYPQSQAFLDAADELGLLVWEEIPGWGYLGDTAWRDAAYADVRDMIVRDRNHPSVIVWGAMPNEAGEHVATYTRYNDLAHSLDPSRPTGGDGSRGDASFVFDVFSVHDYGTVKGFHRVRWPALSPPADAAGKPYLVCEAIGTISGPAKFYRRTDTQFVQQGEAIAHALVQDSSYSQDACCGLIAWAAFDYPSGNGNQYQGIKYVGVADLFRILKPGAAIYQAQVSPATRKVIAPAFYWDFGAVSPVTSLRPAMIASNLDQLKVYVGGDLFAAVTPDRAGYGSLPYPPSFVDFSAVDGSALPGLRIDGYLNGQLVASRRFDADPSRDRLALEADDPAIEAGGADATRVTFRAVDSHGNARPYAGGQVTLTLGGRAVLVGASPFDIGPTGGVGAVWIRSLPGSAGPVTVRASHPSLGTSKVTINIH